MNFKENDIQGLPKIIEGFEDFKRRIISIDYIHNKVEFFEIMKDFRKFLIDIDDGKSFEVFSHSKDYVKYEGFFTPIHEYFLRSIESMQSLSIMTQGIHHYESFSDILDGEVLRESFERKSRELAPFDFSKGGNFVFAGCGPFPETILYMHENSPVNNILGLDYNHEAVYMAGEMVRGLQLSNISFKQIDATEFDYSQVDMVSIPLFVFKKAEIIEQIMKTGKDSVQVIVANPKGFLNLIYEQLGKISDRAKITYREDFSSTFINQEIVKLEKYNF